MSGLRHLGFKVWRGRPPRRDCITTSLSPVCLERHWSNTKRWASKPQPTPCLHAGTGLRIAWSSCLWLFSRLTLAGLKGRAYSPGSCKRDIQHDRNARSIRVVVLTPVPLRRGAETWPYWVRIVTSKSCSMGWWGTNFRPRGASFNFFQKSALGH